MLISKKIKENLGVEITVVDEKEVDALALLAQDPGVPYASFLSDAKYEDIIGENVKMLIVDEKLVDELERKNNSYGLIIAEDPRNLYFKLHNSLQNDPEYIRPRYETKIGSNCNIHETAVIYPYNVTIGDNVTIEEHVSIKENTVIGDGCIIRAGSRIGITDFEFKREGDRLYGVTHLGGVILGKEVEIQGNTLVNKAVYPWDDTTIGDYTKIDDVVQISHGCKIGKGVMIVSHTGIGGRVTIGDWSWIGFNCTIRNGITIGKNARVNMGAVVTQSVGDGEAVSGNFAIPHDQFIEEMKQKRK